MLPTETSCFWLYEKIFKQKRIAEIRESFNKAFNAMIERRDKAEAVFSQETSSEKPTAKQLASFSKLAQKGTHAKIGIISHGFILQRHIMSNHGWVAKE